MSGQRNREQPREQRLHVGYQCLLQSGSVYQHNAVTKLTGWAILVVVGDSCKDATLDFEPLCICKH